MNAIKRYAGVEVSIDAALDQFTIARLHERAVQLSDIAGFDVREFFVYVHRFSVREVPGHFASQLSLKQRIRELELHFQVNKKQAERGLIRFFNGTIDTGDLPRGVREWYGDTRLVRQFPGSLLGKGRTFSTDLLTYVSKSLRRDDHRKIKIHLLLTPTDALKMMWKAKVDSCMTDVDFRLGRSAELRMRDLTDDEIASIREKLRQLGRGNPRAADAVSRPVSKLAKPSIVNSGNAIFISYANSDIAWAEWIADTLETAGFSTIMQAWDFRPGNDFVREMQAATINAARTIAVISDAYLNSSFSQAEWAAAFAGDPDGRKRRLIPVRVAECDVRGLLGTRIFIDLVGRTEFKAREALLGSFASRAKPSLPVAYPRALNKTTINKPYPG